jgi:membrane fusion protein, multidrug efflux system
VTTLAGNCSTARVHPRVWLWLALAASVAACTPERRSSASDSAPVPVRVAMVERSTDAPPQPVAGTVRPLQRATIAARIAGEISGADFVLGQEVAAGELLLTIDARELHARLAQATAALDQAARDAVREKALVEQGAATGETARAAESRLRIAQAAVEEARALVGYTRVTAPFGGTITRKAVYSGDLASPGTPLLELEGRDRLRAEIDVPDTLPRVQAGAAIAVLAGGTRTDGQVAEVSPAVDPVTRTRRVIVALPSGAPVRSGEFVRALWPVAPFPHLWVPLAAVQPFGQIERVFVVREGRAVLRLVKTGAQEGDRVQILSGLEAGETVVVSPPAALRDDAPVRVLP